MTAVSRRSGGQGVAAVVPTILRSRAELDRAVASVLSQTVPVDEIVVVVDVPVDAAALPRWEDPRVTVVVNDGPRHGPGAARAVGVSVATSPLLAWLDDDDVWTPGRLEAQLHVLGDRRDVVVAGRARIVRPDREMLVPDRPPHLGEDLADFLFPPPGLTSSPLRSICTPTLLVPREVLDEHPVDSDLRRWEDYDWLLRVVRAGVGLHIVPETCCVVDQGRDTGVSASSSWYPDEDRRWARARLAPTPRAQDVFLLTYVVPGLVAHGRVDEARREIAAAVRRGAPPVLVLKAIASISGSFRRVVSLRGRVASLFR